MTYDYSSIQVQEGLLALYLLASSINMKCPWSPVHQIKEMLPLKQIIEEQEELSKKLEEQRESVEKTSATMTLGAASAMEETTIHPLKQQIFEEQQDSVEKTSATMTVCVKVLNKGSLPQKKTTIHRRLISFLEKDNSFLTPWSWDPKALVNETSSSTKTKNCRIQILPGSYFARGEFSCFLNCNMGFLY